MERFSNFLKNSSVLIKSNLPLVILHEMYNYLVRAIQDNSTDGVLAKRNPKSEPTKNSLEPVRIERKLIHGQWIGVKIYASAYKPDDTLRVNYNSKKKVFQNTIGSGSDS